MCQSQFIDKYVDFVGFLFVIGLVYVFFLCFWGKTDFVEVGCPGFQEVFVFGQVVFDQSEAQEVFEVYCRVFFYVCFGVFCFVVTE